MARYVIRVEGLLSPSLTSAFPTLESNLHAQTEVRGSFVDPSQLAAVLEQLRDAGVDVVGVHRLPELPARAESGHDPVDRPA